MTALAADAAVTAPADEPGPGRQLGRVVAAEWIKARSVPSTWSAIGSCLFIMATIGAAISSLEDEGPGAPRSEPLLQAMAGISMAQVAVGVLGALLVTGEYSSRSITGTLTAVPQRGTLLAGKATLLVLLLAPFALLGCTAAVLTSLPVLRSRGTTTLDLTSPDVVRAVLAMTLFLVLTALLGLAVGALLRSTAGAVVVLTGLLFLLPVLVELLPGLRDTAGPWLPSQAGAAVLVLGDRDGYLSPAAGMLLVAGYVALALVAAAVRLRRSDA